MVVAVYSTTVEASRLTAVLLRATLQVTVVVVCMRLLTLVVSLR